MLNHVAHSSFCDWEHAEKVQAKIYIFFLALVPCRLPAELMRNFYLFTTRR